MSKIADKLDALADRLQKDIDHARRPMTRNPTPKRMREYNSACTTRTTRERARSTPCGRGRYVRRWWQWVRSGLDGYDLTLAVVKPSPYAAADRLLQVPAVPSPRA